MRRSFFLAMFVMCSFFLPAQSSLQWVQSTYIYGTQELSVNDCYLKGQTIYTISQNLTKVVTRETPAFAVNANDTVVLWLKAGVVLSVTGGLGHPGLGVPDRAVLIIVGEKGSKVVAVGGAATEGQPGQNGGKAYARVTAGPASYGGKGGDGGASGMGGAPGIGGVGGPCTNGGVGGSGAYVPSNKDLAGDHGQSAKNGQNGTNMGIVYVMGEVEVKASKGSAADANKAPHNRASAGGDDRHWGGFAAIGCGGGGGGGNGTAGLVADYDIGGGGAAGGPGGGGGGGSADYATGFFKIEYRTPQGQGGFGGSNGHEYGLQGETDSRHANHSPSDMWSGAGGNGGRAGANGQNGSLIIQDDANIHSQTKCYSVNKLQPGQSPLKTYVRFVHNRVVSGAPQDYMYFFGEKMSEHVNVPRPEDENYIFAGYYDNEMLVYDYQGNLQPQAKDLLYTFRKEIPLCARWKQGQSTIEIVLRYEDTKDGKDNVYQTFVYDSVFHLTMEDVIPFDINPKKYLCEGYSLKDTTHFQGELRAGMALVDTFTYNANTYRILWYIPTAMGDPYNKVYFASGNLAQADYKFGAPITSPNYYFYDADDQYRVKFMGWTNQPPYMPAHGINNNDIILEKIMYPVYIAPNEHGTSVLWDSKQQEVKALQYKNVLIVDEVPQPGYSAAQPSVYVYKEGKEGAPVKADKEEDGAQQGEKRYYYTVQQDELFVHPAYTQNAYSMTVESTSDSVMPEQPLVYANTKDLISAGHSPQLAEAISYHYEDIVYIAGWLPSDNAGDWYGEPIITTTKGGVTDTLHLEWSLMKRATGVNNDSVYMPCYTFVAPAGDVHVHYIFYNLPKSECLFFNLTPNDRIDSVFVNLNPVTLNEDSVVGVRALDIVAITTKLNDASAVQAGYWDDQAIYHTLTKNVYPVRGKGGRWTTYYYTVAPGEPMTMGLVSGLPITLMQCDTALSWIAPTVALEGDTIHYRLEQKDDYDIVTIDSILIYDIDSKLVCRMVGDDLKENRFVMPNKAVFVYVYARKTGRFHTVSFLNADSTLLYTIPWLQVGDSVAYPGHEPVLASGSELYRWKFIGWTPALHPVDSDDVYVATYRKYIRLDENQSNDSILKITDGQVVGVDLYRTMSYEYYVAFCLPFTLTMKQVEQYFGERTVLAEFTSSELEGGARFNFSLVYNDSLLAGMPYMILPSRSIDSVTIDSVVIDYHVDTVRQEYAEFRAIVNPQWLPDGDKHYMFASYAKLYYPKNCSGPLRGFRAYFYTMNGMSANNYPVLAAEAANFCTGYMEAEGLAADPYTGAIYNASTEVDWIAPMDGHSNAVKILHHGVLYIQIDGQMYDVQGQRL